MTQPSPVALQCPTRLDGHAPLIAHAIPAAVCASRQASGYHKCPSCALAKGNEAKPRARELEVVAPVAQPKVVAPAPAPAVRPVRSA